MSGISTTQEEQIKELLSKGQKVSAVKLYRGDSTNQHIIIFSFFGIFFKKIFFNQRCC